MFQLCPFFRPNFGSLSPLHEVSLSEEAYLCLLCFPSVDDTSEDRGGGKEDVRLWASEPERGGVE